MSESWDKRRAELEALAAKFAQAESERVQLEHFRKHKKAKLMKDAETAGYNTIAAQEREAYASDEYAELIKGLAGATEIAAFAKWKLEIAKMGLDVWRTKEATKRAEMGMR